MDEKIDSLVITRLGTDFWVYDVNESTKNNSEDAYTGSLKGDFITIKSLNGAPQIQDVYFGVMQYIDNLNSANNMLNPSSADELFGHLLSQGFFVGSDDNTGGGVSTFKALLDVDVATFAGNEDKFFKINAAGTKIIATDNPANNFKITDALDWEGTENPIEGFTIVATSTGFTQAPLSSNISDQDNIDITKYFLYDAEDTAQEILEKINNIPAYGVNEKQSVWFRGRSRYVSGTIKPYLTYKMLNKGKGVYGNGATQLVQLDLLPFVNTTPTATDIEDDPSTQLITYGDLNGQTVSQWLNSQNPPIVIQPQDEGYTLFQGTIDGIQKDYLFVGESGSYGVGQLQSIAGDFQLLSDAIPAVDGVQSVSGNIVNNTDPGNPIINGVSSVTGDYVNVSDPANPVINEKKDLPEGFIVSASGTGDLGSQLKYIVGDEIKSIYVEPTYIPAVNGNASHVFVDGNATYASFFRVDPADPNFRLAIKFKFESHIINDTLVPYKWQYHEIPKSQFSMTVSPSITEHAEAFGGGFWYTCTRETTQPCRILKTDINDVSKVTIGIPFNGGNITNIELYREYLYMVWANPANNSQTELRRVHINNLDKYETVFYLLHN